MSDLSRFAINQITTKSWSMPQAIEGYSRHGVPGIACWRNYLDDYGARETARHLKDAGMWVASLCTSAWFDAEDAAGIRRAIDENKRILDDGATIGAPSLVMVVGPLPGTSRDLAGHRARIGDALEVLAEHAVQTGVKLGIEPLHPMYCGYRSVISTIAQANDLCDRLGPQASGLVPDVYHCWWDPEFRAGLERAGKDRILTFHLCDWLVPTRNLFDRGMVGDGVIDLPAIRGWLDEIGYDGCFELEIFSELDWWQRDPDETVRIAVERCAPLVGPLTPAQKGTA